MKWNIYAMVTNSSAYPFVPVKPYTQGTGSTFYDWDRHSMLEVYDDFCVPIFEQGNNWRCHFLNINGTSYLVSWDGPLSPCCVFAEDFNPPSPDFLNAAKVPFNKTTSLEGRDVNWWVLDGDDPAEPFGYGFVADKHAVGTPAGFWFRSDNGYASQIFYDVDVSRPDPRTWDLPSACVNAPSCNFF